MAVYFNLTRKSAPEAGPVVLSALDVEICTLTDQPVHESKYCLGWFDMIGYWLAVGKTWAEIRTMHAEWRRADARGLEGENLEGHNAYHDLLAKVVDWLEANFIVESWGR